MKEQVVKNNRPTKPKGILLSLFEIIFNLILIVLSGTFVLCVVDFCKNLFLKPFHYSITDQLLYSMISVMNTEFSKIRLFLESLPLMGLIIGIFLIDGLAQRDIRKFQCARESTYLFHRPKPILSFCFYIPMFVYFATPTLFNSEIFFIVIAIVLGLIIHVSVKNFKKYL
jgi:integrating conjugative element membrane protein (TIGR03747 family)